MEDSNIKQEAEKARKKEISKLLTEVPLYKSVELVDFYARDINFLVNHTFNAFCKKENSIQTFSLYNSSEFNSIYFKAHETSREKGELVSFTDYFCGLCASCKKYKIDFLINVYSEKPEKLINAGLKPGEKFIQESIYLRKMGQYPPFEIKPEKEISDYLTEEDVSYYKKALRNIALGYGIGAFAYFRRIIENEIKRMITDISRLTTDTEIKMGDVLAKYEKDFQMSSLINEITKYLPQSLKSLGDNPVRLLYDQSSIALHTLTEEQCLEKALIIDRVLKFVIKQINSEKNEIRPIKDDLKKLKEGK